MSQPKPTMPQIKTSFGFTKQTDDSKDLGVKLVLYDFDQTITCDHLYYELDGGQEDELKKMSDDKLLDVFGGDDRKERLIQHFERIESSNCELVILSFGWQQVIKNALIRMGMFRFFDKNTSIIGKDSQLLKIANNSKAQCISKMKSDKKLRSAQILFIDDDNVNIRRATRYCQAILIDQRKGMTLEHMEQIEGKCGVLNLEAISLDITTPKTVQSQISKHYPSQPQNNGNGNGNKKRNKLDKYKITSVPDWFGALSNTETDTPVIQIGGDQTPVSESGEYELNVPLLNNELADINNKQNNELSLNNFDSTDLSDNYNENDDGGNNQEQKPEINK